MEAAENALALGEGDMHPGLLGATGEAEGFGDIVGITAGDPADRLAEEGSLDLQALAVVIVVEVVQAGVGGELAQLYFQVGGQSGYG